MEAVWWLGNEKELSFKNDVPVPTMKSPNDVKIQVLYSGICGSDFHFMNDEMGKFSAKKDGVILGHEFSGTVVEVGKAAEKKFQVGDLVCVNPNECCGKCSWAEKGSPHFCEANEGVGIAVDGGWTQFCVVPDNKVYKLPDNLSAMQGALVEPYSCVVRGWKVLEPFRSKDCKVLIQGAGIIGNLFCTLFHHHAFTNVTVTEPNDARRKLCSEMNLGFDVVHPREVDLQLAEKDSEKYGFEVIVDCTGNPSAVEKAFEHACRGAKICVFGCCPAGKKISIEPFQIYWKELSVVGSFISPFCFEETLQLLGNLTRGGYVDYKKLGIQVFKLNQYQEAIEHLKSGKASKSIFEINK